MRRREYNLFVPAHTIWLLSDSDVKARLAVSRTYLRRMHESTIGLEAVQREQSLTKSRLRAQASKIAEVKREVASMGASAVLSVHAPYTPIGKFDLASDSNETRRRTIEAVTRCIELAEDIEASVVNAHLGGIIRIGRNRSFQDPAAKSALLGRVKDALIEITDRIEGRNVRLAIENIPYPLEEINRGYSPLIGVFPSDFSMILSDVDSKCLGMTIDFCHLWITHKTLKGFLMGSKRNHGSGAAHVSKYRGLTSYEADEIEFLSENPFAAFIQRLSEKIVHVHVADTDGIYVPGKSNVTEGNSLGHGDLDLGGFANALWEIEEHSTKTGLIMIVLEPKEKDFDRPLNALASLMELGGLIRRK